MASTKKVKGKKPKAKIKSNKVQFYLDEQKMTQQELADRTGTNRAHISKIAKQNSPSISLPVAMKIAGVLNVSIEDLFEMEINKDDE